MKRIYIKAWFGDWYEVSYEKALEFCRNMFQGIMNIKDKQERVKYVNQKHVKGIEFKLEDLDYDSYSE